ncbi:MAG: hypothetical protein ACR652_18250 [Methylocystis sp.]|uniref:hypothetical protein n=1 Tax=Methylocystis sp. TaxID=1911079 RepID=UPI003DA4684F
MNRVQIYLRLAANGGLERNADRDNEDGWLDTALSMDTEYGEEHETLGDLIKKFEDVFDAQDPIAQLSALLPVETQRRIGDVIRRGLFGVHDPDVDMRWLHLVPCPRDPRDPEAKKLFDLVCRLPWIFLSGDDGRGPYFLAFQLQRPFYVTIDAAPRAAGDNVRREVKMPPQPRILLVVADPVKPTELERTFGRAHADELMQALAPSYLREGRDYKSNLKFVRSYAEFQAALVGGPNSAPFDPDIIYFYGHGYPEEVSGMCLEFEGPAAADGRGPPEPRSIADISKLFTDAFWESQRRPVVWVNACFGASSPGLNALTAFSARASCVITSRTAAATAQSRDQALIGLPALAAGYAPPAAIWRALRNTDQTLLGARWATTVVSVQYEVWSALDTENRNLDDAESVGDFPMRLDRTAPLRLVESRLVALTAERPLAFMWTGGFDDSVNLFKERVEDRLSEYFRDRRAQVRQIDLQAVRPRVVPDQAATEGENVGQADAALRAQFLIAAYCGLNFPRDPSKVKRKTIADIAESLERIAGGEGAVLFLGHGLGDPDPGIGDLIRKYLDFWAGLTKEPRIASLKLPIILGFVHSGEGELAVKAPNAELVEIALEPIGASELYEHIDVYNAFYSFDRLELHETAEGLVNACRGRFRQIHLKLEAQLDEKFQSDEYYRDAMGRKA